jgi:hypothetical protein
MRWSGFSSELAVTKAITPLSVPYNEKICSRYIVMYPMRNDSCEISLHENGPVGQRVSLPPPINNPNTTKLLHISGVRLSSHFRASPICATQSL